MEVEITKAAFLKNALDVKETCPTFKSHVCNGHYS